MCSKFLLGVFGCVLVLFGSGSGPYANSAGLGFGSSVCKKHALLFVCVLVSRVGSEKFSGVSGMKKRHVFVLE